MILCVAQNTELEQCVWVNVNEQGMVWTCVVKPFTSNIMLFKYDITRYPKIENTKAFGLLKNEYKNQIYKHFKGNIYKTICNAIVGVNKVEYMIYKNITENHECYGKIYARPMAMFKSKVNKFKHPDIVQEYRFERMEELENGKKFNV